MPDRRIPVISSGAQGLSRPALAVADPAGTTGSLTADRPLHLEDHLDVATVSGGVRKCLVPCLVTVCLLVPAPARAQNWPSFRGPQAAGVADDQNLPTVWDVGKVGQHSLEDADSGPRALQSHRLGGPCLRDHGREQ